MKRGFWLGWGAAIMLLLLAFLLGRISTRAPVASMVISIDPTSFSEVQNAKTVIEGLAREYVTSLHQFRSGYLNDPAGMSREERRDRALNSLLERQQEFIGTSAAELVTRELLLTLRGSGDQQTWLRVYFSYLYQNPTHSLVEELADAAEEVALANGASGELEKARQFLSLIPERATEVKLAGNTRNLRGIESAPRL